MTDNHYVIMKRGEILGVVEFSDEEALKKYITLFPRKPIYYQSLDEADAWEVRRKIKIELKRDVQNIIRQLWGNIGEKIT